jgi:hypothetical protein
MPLLLAFCIPVLTWDLSRFRHPSAKVRTQFTAYFCCGFRPDTLSAAVSVTMRDATAREWEATTVACARAHGAQARSAASPASRSGRDHVLEASRSHRFFPAPCSAFGRPCGAGPRKPSRARLVSFSGAENDAAPPWRVPSIRNARATKSTFVATRPFVTRVGGELGRSRLFMLFQRPSCAVAYDDCALRRRVSAE